MDKQQLKERACAAIDKHRAEIIQFGKDRANCPELGFNEFKTAAAVREKLSAIGVTDIQPVAFTGVKGWLRGRAQKATVMLMGELDAVLADGKPTHACGHAAQLAVLVGCAAGLKTVMPFLDGAVCFAATPAEEFIQIEERLALCREGKITRISGKQQMHHEKAFDDIDLAMMVHAETNTPGTQVKIGGTSLGFIAKEIRFIGKEAHAALAPWQGINALNAASLALQAIHALRETFPDKDFIRVHPIITKGGDIVNTVPADVRMSCFVRALTPEAMEKTNAAVNRAITHCAKALGATAEIHDIPGYMPLKQNHLMGRFFAENAKNIAPDVIITEGELFGGSTDMGDVSQIIPSIHPTINGFSGALHSADFAVTDEELAYILPAKLLTMTTIDLLADGAEGALSIKNDSTQN